MSKPIAIRTDFLIWAAKTFFPHLTPTSGQACVMAILMVHIKNETRPLSKE